MIDKTFVCFAPAGLKDAVDEIVAHSSLVCMIITSQSEHSLYPCLTEMHGSHFIQGFVNIQPPDQVGCHTDVHIHIHMMTIKKKLGEKKKTLCYCLQTQRAEILRHLILRKPFLPEETLDALDLGAVAKETEGCTAQDLTLLLERAIHANTIQKGNGDQGTKIHRLHYTR